MLCAIELEGFKRFGPRTRIPLSYFNLLLGSNASGKSSVFQALLLLRQSFEAGPAGFLTLHPHDRLVDLGSFTNLASGNPRHGGRVSFGFEVRRDCWVRLVYQGYTPNRVAGDEPDQLGALLELSIELDGGLSLRLAGFEEAEGRGAVVATGRLELAGTPPAFSPLVRATWRVGEAAYEVEVDESTDWEELERPASASEYLGLLRERAGDHSGPLHAALTTTQVEAVAGSGGEGAPAVLAEFVKRILQFYLYDKVVDRLAHFRHLGPTRLPGRRHYPAWPTPHDGVGSRGEHLASSLLRGRRLDTVNRWLAEIGVPYALRVEMLRSIDRSVDLRVRDTRGGGHEVGVGDVGFGVSQLLPILVEFAGIEERERSAAGAGRPLPEQMLCVEQPELHLHPRWQVRLLQRVLARRLIEWRFRERSADLRNEPEPVPPSTQVILETHSEVAVNAVQQLVRSGLVEPDDVCILSFEVEPDGSPDVRRIELDADGRFCAPWPRGFFAERRELLLEDVDLDDLFERSAEEG